MQQTHVQINYVSTFLFLDQIQPTCVEQDTPVEVALNLQSAYKVKWRSSSLSMKINKTKSMHENVPVNYFHIALLIQLSAQSVEYDIVLLFDRAEKNGLYLSIFV